MASPITPFQLGPYLADRELGRGAMGVVYRAQDPRSGRHVAVKVLLQQSHGEHARAFLEEALAGKKLDHPHCLKSYEVLYLGANQSPAIVSEYVEGSNLREFLDSIQSSEPRPRFSPLAATLILEQCFLGLREAHKAGLIHQDIKPENYLLPQWAIDRIEAALDDPEDLENELLDMRDMAWIKLSDWGLAVLKERERSSNAQSLSLSLSQIPEGKRGGTVVYMPLEQIDGVGISRRTDIFALSLIFYELLSGSPPIQARVTAEGLSPDCFENLQVYLVQMINSPALSAIDPKKDKALRHLKRLPRLRAVLLGMSKRQKNDRFSSGELQDEIEGLIEEFESEPNSSSVLSIVVCVLFLLLPIGLYFAFSQGPSAKQPTPKIAVKSKKKAPAKADLDSNSKDPGKSPPKIEIPPSPKPIEKAPPKKADPVIIAPASPALLAKLRKGDSLALREVKHVDEEVGKILGAWTRSVMFLREAETLSLAGARALAQYKGALYLENIMSMNGETARALVGYRGHSLKVAFKKRVENEVFQALGQFKGMSLTVGYSEPLTRENGQALAAYSGTLLNLRGASLGEAAAVSLAASKAKTLTFFDVTKISVLTAAALSRYKGGALSFPRLETLDGEVAAALAVSQCNALSLMGLQRLSPTGAKLLARYGGMGLSVGMSSLTPKIAKGLAEFSGMSLTFHNLTTLSIPIAKELSHSRALSLSFFKLDQMNAIAAKELAQFGGSILSFRGTFKPKGIHGFSLNQFTGSTIDLSQSGWVSQRFIENMKSFTGELKLPPKQVPYFKEQREAFLRSLPPWQLNQRSLVRAKRTLVVETVTSLCREAAHEIQKGPAVSLNFKELKELDFLCAGHLARSRATSLSFPKLKKLSDESRRALLRFKGPIRINGRAFKEANKE